MLPSVFPRFIRQQTGCSTCAAPTRAFNSCCSPSIRYFLVRHDPSPWIQFAAWPQHDVQLLVSTAMCVFPPRWATALFGPMDLQIGVYLGFLLD